MFRFSKFCSVMLLCSLSVFLGGCSAGSATGGPPPVPPTVILLTLNPNALQGGATSTATVTINAPAPTGGVVVQLTSDNNVVAPVPTTITVQAGLTSATFQIVTTVVGISTNPTITATLNGSVHAQLTVTPVSTAVLQSFTLLPGSVQSGSSSTGTVTLVAMVPVDTPIALGSSNPAVPVQSSVIVLANHLSATFTITGPSVAASTTVTITATLNAASKTAMVTITPIPPKVISVSFSPNPVVGGHVTTGTVVISLAALAGGQAVAISAAPPVAGLPVSVTVPAGATSVSIPVTPPAVAVATSVIFTATLNGAAMTTLTVNPPAVTSVTLNPTSVIGGAANSTGMVNLNGPAPAGGTAVTLVSGNTTAATVVSSITVPAGATSTMFTATSKVVGSIMTSIITATGATGGVAMSTLTVNPVASAMVSEQIILGGETESLNFPRTNSSTLTAGQDSGYVASINLQTTAAGVTTTTKPATFSTYVGQGVFGQVRDAFVDAQGNIYACGITDNQSLPVTPGVVQPAFAGAYRDGFIVKYSPTGVVLALTYIGGGIGPVASGMTQAQTAETFCYNITLDASGFVYVSGRTSSTDLPVVIHAPAGSFQPAYGGGGNNPPHFGGDLWIAKLNPNMAGPAAVWATYVGGMGDDGSRGRIAVDLSGNVIVGGFGQSTADFPVPSGQTLPNLTNVFNFGAVVKISADGKNLLYTKLFFGNVAAPTAPPVGTTSNASGSVIINPAGEAYVCGFSNASDFLTAIGAPPGGFQTTFKGTRASAYVAKISTTGQLQAVTLLGGSGNASGNTEECKGLAFDSAGNVIVLTPTNSTDYPVTPGVFQATLAPGATSNMAVTKLTPDLSHAIFSTYIGGNGDDELDAGRVELDANENIWVPFFTTSTDLLARTVVTANGFQTALAGLTDVVFVKLSADGLKILYGSYLGGSTNDNPRVIRYHKN